MSIVDARAAVAAVRNIQVGPALPVRGSEPQLLLLEITKEAPGQTAGTVLNQTPALAARCSSARSIEAVVAK